MKEMPKIPTNIRIQMMTRAKEAIQKAGAAYDTDIQDHAETVIKALSIGDIRRAYKMAYHIKATASAYDWPVIGGIAGLLLDRLDGTQDQNDHIRIGLRFIKPMILFSIADFKGKANMVAPIVGEIEADLKKYKL